MKLIDKEVILAIIENELSYYKDLEDRGIISDCGIAAYRVVKMLKSDIESLEEKEVDLEKEHKDWLHQHFDGRRDHNASGDYLQRSSQLDMAKHFFELGLKAQKGE